MRETPPKTLDIRAFRCPLTFVYAKVMVEEMEEGEEALIYFADTEAKRLPESMAGLEVDILEQRREGEGRVMRIRRL